MPDLRDLVLAAIAAGKHVYCEWPLALNSAEAEELRDAADKAGVHHAIGLQLRESPTTRAVRSALDTGSIGRILSVSAFSSSAGFGANVARAFAYLEDPATFANLVTIQGAHTLDLVMAIDGEFGSISALLTRQFSSITVEGEDQSRRRQTYDHLLAQGIIGDGTSYSVEVAGGRTDATPFYLDIMGDKGTIRLAGGAPRGVQSARISWSLNGEPKIVAEKELAGLPDAAANVGGVYAALHRDIMTGTRTVTGFDHAVHLTRLVEMTLDSSERGRREYPRR